MHSFLNRMYCAGALIAGSLLLSGCGGFGGVELNGGIFDMLGVSQLGQKKAEPKMTQRTGIVVPPRTAALPVPGSRPAPQQVASADGQQWPVNPEDARNAQQAAVKSQHEAFCADQRRKLDAKLIDTMENGPLGSCHKSVLNTLGISTTPNREVPEKSQ